ncbi:MAG: glycosyl transferase [Candidatus Cloacimonadaceae bacterium]
MNKLLLITYYFPPCGGASVQRWLRLLPHLVEAGFEVTVLTTEDGDYPQRDESLLALIPEKVRVARTFTPVFGKLWKSLTAKDEPLPYGSLKLPETSSILKKSMFWFRLNTVSPDARVIWNPFARKQAIQLLKTENFDWIVTTGPPHSTHLVGMYLKKRFKIKWLADFRDPWTQIFYLQEKKQNSFIKQRNKKLESKVVKTADVNLIVSQSIANQLPAGNKLVFYNGYEAGQFSQLKYEKAEHFRIKFIGQLTEGQDINSLLDYLSLAAERNSMQDIAFSFVGAHLTETAKYYFPIVKTGFLPHEQALAEMVNSELLILLINQYADNQGMLTTKLFEYIAARTPILCIGPADGEASTIIRQSQSGLVFEKTNPEIETYLLDLYQKWQSGIPVRNDQDISQWSAGQQIKKLVSLLS